MDSKAEKILSKGLKEGYAGKSRHVSTKRGPFTLKATEITFPDGSLYNDHWIFKRTGGGQEIAQSGNDMATRVFAGGVVNEEKLISLGIKEQDVVEYLKKVLPTVANKTRLHENIKPELDGEWQYEYIILKQYPEILLSIGVETIKYKNETVFVHAFLNTPIK